MMDMESSLQIQNEVALQLTERSEADAHHDHGTADAGDPGVGAGHRAVHDKAPHTVDVMVQRVQLDDRHHEGRQRRDGIKQRCSVHPGHRQDTVQVLQVAEVDRQRRKQHGHAAAERQQQQKRCPDEQNRPVERRAGDKHDQQDGRQAEQQVHKAGHHAADGKNELGHVYFFDKRRIAQHTAHAHVRALVEEVEQGVAADEIQREVRDVEPEHVGENERLQQHHEQRV